VRRSYRLCRHCGDLHQLGRWPDNCKDEAPQRSDHPAPFVVRDTLPGGVNGLYHHAALRKFDSKAAYRQATKDAGCIEIGNEYAAANARRSVDIDDRVIESGVNEALHQHGISSESDMGKLQWSVTPTTT
jgi:hypothetical protein